jgi:solute carrier family 30 (zinc transporter), member 1
MQQRSEMEISQVIDEARDSEEAQMQSSALQKGSVLIDVGDESSDSLNGSQDLENKYHHGAGSMNMRALVLHVLGDALGNIGVIATGLIIWLSQWRYRFYFDPIISLVITVIIFSSAMPLGMYFSIFSASSDSNL